MVELSEIRWEVRREARNIEALRREMGEAVYAEVVRTTKLMLLGYFNNIASCTVAQGSSIRPVGATPKGGKILKVRALYPGCGKSGGLRLAVVAYCDARRVYVAEAWRRNTDPDDDDFAEATKAM